MTWLEEHIEWIAGGIVTMLGAVGGFLFRIAWNDREAVMVRLDTIEDVTRDHTVRIASLNEDVKHAQSTAHEEQKTIAMKLEQHYEERREDSIQIHTRITEVARGVSRIEGALEQLKETNLALLKRAMRNET